jgi:hypothetical protein
MEKIDEKNPFILLTMFVKQLRTQLELCITVCRVYTHLHEFETRVVKIKV